MLKWAINFLYLTVLNCWALCSFTSGGPSKILHKLKFQLSVGRCFEVLSDMFPEPTLDFKYLINHSWQRVPNPLFYEDTCLYCLSVYTPPTHTHTCILHTHTHTHTHFFKFCPPLPYPHSFCCLVSLVGCATMPELIMCYSA